MTNTLDATSAATATEARALGRPPGAGGAWTGGGPAGVGRSDANGGVGEPAGRSVRAVLIEGGDLACGELLMLVHRRVRSAAAGTVVSIATTDLAAPIDIPAWCHLTGHRYVGVTTGVARRFVIELVPAPNAVDPDKPWRPTASSQSTPDDPGVHP